METNEEKPSVLQLTDIYLKIRDKKEEVQKQFDEQLKDLEEQLEVVEAELLELCKDLESDSIKTQSGTVMRRVSTRYWTNDWDSMYNFIKENDALELFEKRVSQGNMKQFLDENPDKFPPGMLVDSKYKITVRRSRK